MLAGVVVAVRVIVTVQFFSFIVTAQMVLVEMLLVLVVVVVEIPQIAAVGAVHMVVDRAVDQAHLLIFLNG